MNIPRAHVVWIENNVSRVGHDLSEESIFINILKVFKMSKFSFLKRFLCVLKHSFGKVDCFFSIDCVVNKLFQAICDYLYFSL